VQAVKTEPYGYDALAMGHSYGCLDLVFRVVDKKTLAGRQGAHVHWAELKRSVSVEVKKQVHVFPL
jgi:hypothetical protein